MEPLEQFVTKDELAALLRMTRSGVDDLRRAGVLPPPVKLGRARVGWRRSVIDNYLVSRQVAR